MNYEVLENIEKIEKSIKDYEVLKKIEKNTRKTAGVLRLWNFLIFLGTIIYILSQFAD